MYDTKANTTKGKIAKLGTHFFSSRLVKASYTTYSTAAPLIGQDGFWADPSEICRLLVHLVYLKGAARPLVRHHRVPSSCGQRGGNDVISSCHATIEEG